MFTILWLCRRKQTSKLQFLKFGRWRAFSSLSAEDERKPQPSEQAQERCGRAEC
jgi:hypothetical protein